MEKKFQSLYSYPRLLYKYYTISSEYATKYSVGDGIDGYMFTPNIPRAEMESNVEYTVVDKWRMIIFDGLLFYTSPVFFNDPFDSMLPNIPDRVPAIDERREIIQLLNGIHNLKSEDINRLLFCDDFERSLSMILTTIGLSKVQQDQLYKHIKLTEKRYREEIAMACFSERKDSKLMWAHYANSYSGFCIEYDFAKISDIEFLKGIGKVIYNDKKPQEYEFDSYNEYAKMMLATKATYWEYEEEWRSIMIMTPNMYMNKMYPIINVKPCITAIYMGCNMSKDYQNEVIKYYKNSNVAVYQMQLSDTEFDFDFI